MVSEQVLKLTSWVGMAPKKNRKQPQDSMLEEPVDDQVAPPESIGEEEPMPREDRNAFPSHGVKPTWGFHKVKLRKVETWRHAPSFQL